MLGGFEYYVREGYPVEGEHAERHGKPTRVASCAPQVRRCAGGAARASAPASPRRLWRRPSEHGHARGAHRARARRPGRGRDLGPAERWWRPAPAGPRPRRRRPRVAARRARALGARPRLGLRPPARRDDAVSRTHAEIAVRAGSAWSATSTRATGRCSTAAPSAAHGSAAGTCWCSARPSSACASRRPRARSCPARTRGVERVLAAAAGDRERVERASAWLTLTVHGRPGQRRRAGDDDLARELQRVGLAVPATVTRSAADVAAGVIGSGARLMSTSCAPVRQGRRSRTCPRRRRAPGRSPPRRRGPARRRRRVRRSPRPSASSANASASLVPLKDSESRLAPPSTTSLPSPGFQLKRSKSPPSSATSAPLPPLTSSKPSPPIRWSLPGPPIRTLSPPPPTSVRSIVADRRADDVVAAAAVDRQVAVERRVDELHERRAEQPEAADEIWSSSSEPYAVVRLGVGVDLERRRSRRGRRP